jgi:formate C-acetyltransferase
LNIRFQPDLIYCEGGIDNWAALVRMYHEAGGQHVQFNVVSTETLRDAQEHPEKYPDLLVRVAGYSAYFTSLAKPIQDDIISRTEYESW